MRFNLLVQKIAFIHIPISQFIIFFRNTHELLRWLRRKYWIQPASSFNTNQKERKCVFYSILPLAMSIIRWYSFNRVHTKSKGFIWSSVDHSQTIKGSQTNGKLDCWAQQRWSMGFGPIEAWPNPNSIIMLCRYFVTNDNNQLSDEIDA